MKINYFEDQTFEIIGIILTITKGQVKSLIEDGVLKTSSLNYIFSKLYIYITSDFG